MKQAYIKAGVDFTDPKTIAKFAKNNPETGPFEFYLGAPNDRDLERRLFGNCSFLVIAIFRRIL